MLIRFRLRSGSVSTIKTITGSSLRAAMDAVFPVF
jgi:hypothetical protein